MAKLQSLVPTLGTSRYHLDQREEEEEQRGGLMKGVEKAEDEEEVKGEGGEGGRCKGCRESKNDPNEKTIVTTKIEWYTR